MMDDEFEIEGELGFSEVINQSCTLGEVRDDSRESSQVHGISLLAQELDWSLTGA